MTVTVVDFGAGNVGSVVNMLNRVGGEPRPTGDPEHVASAAKVLLPGVGSFDAAMKRLRSAGLVDALEAVREAGRPILGICLGMQLLAERSEEGDEPGLGWLRARVIRLSAAGEERLRVPQMGWNTVRVNRACELMSPDEDARYYFAHSYAMECEADDDIVGFTTYGSEFVSVVNHGNVYGTQFHPEKSHRHGLRLLERFVDL